jgi:hypothetical protein
MRRVSAVFTVRKHWLNANLDAPAWRANTSCCPTAGSRQNLNVVCRLISPATITRPTDNTLTCSDVSDSLIVGSVTGPDPTHLRGVATGATALTCAVAHVFWRHNENRFHFVWC